MNPDSGTCDPFDDEQLMTMFDAIRVAPECGVTEEEMQRLYDWAHRAYIGSFLLDWLLQGEIVVIGFEGDEPRFAAPEVADRRDAVAIAEQIALGGNR